MRQSLQNDGTMKILRVGFTTRAIYRARIQQIFILKINKITTKAWDYLSFTKVWMKRWDILAYLKIICLAA